MNKQAFLTHIAIEAETLEIWLAQAWLVPATTADEPQFSDADIARARLIRDLRDGCGVNDPGVDVILHLIDQLHGLRQAFEGLRETSGQRPLPPSGRLG